jgi:hypothetical protein
MGPIEDATIFVVEPTAEKPETDRPVSDVRESDHDSTPRPKKREETPEGRHRVFEMLQHVDQEYNIETLRRPRERNG